MRIIADYKHYKQLNEEVFQAVQAGVAELTLEDVNGQRFIADCLTGKLKIDIYGTPGNDLGMFMDGPTVTVFGNAQDGVGVAVARSPYATWRGKHHEFWEDNHTRGRARHFGSQHEGGQDLCPRRRRL